MAVTDPHPLRQLAQAARPAPGSLRLALYHLLLLLLTAVPPFLVTLLPLLGRQARQPWFTDHDAPLPGITALHLLASLPTALVPVAIATVAAVVVASLFLSAGALAVADPARTGLPSCSILSRITDAGTHHLWPLTRLLLAIATLDALAVLALQTATDALARHGESSGWSAMACELTLPALGALGAALAVAALGALGLLARALLVLDDRHRALRALWLALRLAARRPLAAIPTLLALSLLAQTASAAFLALWRQTAPASTPALTATALAWLALLAASAWIWLLSHRYAVLLWTRHDLTDLRQTPDTPPYGLTRLPTRLWRRLRRTSTAA